MPDGASDTELGGVESRGAAVGDGGRRRRQQQSLINGTEAGPKASIPGG